MKRLTLSHKINFGLAFLAFAFFVANQYNVFAEQRLDLHGQFGALVLTGFLAVGILVQLGKLAQGHQHWFELLVTLLLLAAHVVAEVAIWVRTQIMGVDIPSTLPLWIVGLYWVVGLIDYLAYFLPHELGLFKGESFAQQQQRELERMRMELALEQQQRRFAERIAEQSQSKGAATGTEIAAFAQQCDQCGQTLRAGSPRGLKNAINAHTRWCAGKEVASTSNGHH